MQTYETFRRVELEMAGAVQGAHMGHPDFRVNGKIFATLHPDYKFGMVKLTPEQQQRFVRDYPDVFAPEKGAWGLAGSTAVCLNLVSDDTLGEAITLAWQNIVVKSNAPKDKRPTRKSRWADGAFPGTSEAMVVQSAHAESCPFVYRFNPQGATHLRQRHDNTVRENDILNPTSDDLPNFAQ